METPLYTFDHREFSFEKEQRFVYQGADVPVNVPVEGPEPSDDAEAPDPVDDPDAAEREGDDLKKNADRDAEAKIKAAVDSLEKQIAALEITLEDAEKNGGDLAKIQSQIDEREKIIADLLAPTKDAEEEVGGDAGALLASAIGGIDLQELEESEPNPRGEEDDKEKDKEKLEAEQVKKYKEMMVALEKWASEQGIDIDFDEDQIIESVKKGDTNAVMEDLVGSMKKSMEKMGKPSNEEQAALDTFCKGMVERMIAKDDKIDSWIEEQFKENTDLASLVERFNEEAAKKKRENDEAAAGSPRLSKIGAELSGHLANLNTIIKRNGDGEEAQKVIAKMNDLVKDALDADAEKGEKLLAVFAGREFLHKAEGKSSLIALQYEEGKFSLGEPKERAQPTTRGEQLDQQIEDAKREMEYAMDGWERFIAAMKVFGAMVQQMQLAFGKDGKSLDDPIAKKEGGKDTTDATETENAAAEKADAVLLKEIREGGGVAAMRQTIDADITNNDATLVGLQRKTATARQTQGAAKTAIGEAELALTDPDITDLAREDAEGQLKTAKKTLKNATTDLNEAETEMEEIKNKNVGLREKKGKIDEMKALMEKQTADANVEIDNFVASVQAMANNGMPYAQKFVDMFKNINIDLDADQLTKKAVDSTGALNLYTQMSALAAEAKVTMGEVGMDANGEVKDLNNLLATVTKMADIVTERSESIRRNNERGYKFLERNNAAEIGNGGVYALDQGDGFVTQYYANPNDGEWQWKDAAAPGWKFINQNVYTDASDEAEEASRIAKELYNIQES